MTLDEKERPQLYAEYRGPGPLAYPLKPLTGRQDHDQTKKQAPAYSIGLPRLAQANRTPGPSDYSVSDPLETRLPPITLKGRPKIPAPSSVGPAPGAYNAVKPDRLSNKRSAPCPVIGSRFKIPDYRCGPGPTAYSLPGTVGNGVIGTTTGKKPPHWSFRSRLHHGGPHYEGYSKNVPAPTLYTCPEPGVYKKSRGNFSMQGRTQQPVYNTARFNPAPGQYDPGYAMGKAGKGPSMGTRHSNHVLLCLTHADTVY